MRLHEDETLFRQAVAATADRLDIPEIFIEKDYWVTYALHTIFHDPIGEDKLKTTYTVDFRGLVYRGLPDEQQIFTTLTRIKERLLEVEWEVEV